MKAEIGFTGTRAGMSERQGLGLQRLFLWLDQYEDVPIFHHGDEEHADRQAAVVARENGFIIRPHPPRSKKAEDLLARDRDIVDAADLLIAAPRTLDEQMRGSGTWYTIRKARQAGVPVVLLDP